MVGELSSSLGEYAVTFRLEDLAAPDRAHLIDATVNWVGCAIGGSRGAPVQVAANAFLAVSPHGTSRALGRTERFDLKDAVAMDCFMSAVLAYDDTHLETVLHPTGPVAAALFGASRLSPLAGREFLAALHVGMEIECRSALAFTTTGTGAKRGWYATGIAGGIGAAAAVARVLGFDKPRVQNAMGLAAAHASGNRGTHGSMTAAFVPSFAAVDGFMAATMTNAGLTCGSRALDGKSGLLDLITESPAIDRALRDLGAISEASRTAFKPYPCGIVVHPIIDACLMLCKEHGVAAQDVETLQFHVSRTAYDLAANRFPRDTIEAQVSLFYWAAVTLQCGHAGIEQTSPQWVHDPILLELQRKISAQASDEFADDQCVAIVTCRGGSSIEVKVAHAVGSIDHPMTSEDIDRKFFSLTQPLLTPWRVQKLHEACRNITRLEDVSTILTI